MKRRLASIVLFILVLCAASYFATRTHRTMVYDASGHLLYTDVLAGDPQIPIITRQSVNDYQCLPNPGNPPTGYVRIYCDSSTGQLNALTSTGANGFPATGGAASLSGNAAPIFMSPSCPVNPGTGNCYFVNADVKACFDGTVTSGSPNISSAGQCQWTSADVGKKVFVTNLCSPTQCSFAVGLASTTILPSTQLKVGRIATVTDATHIIVDCTSPGNCVSPNASASRSGQAVVVYGTDDTSNLNAAFAALGNGSTGCPTLVLPRGMMFFNAKIWTVIPTIATNACTSPSVSTVGSSKFQNFGQAVGNSAIAIMGQGPTSSTLVPTPDFNYAGCDGPSGAGTTCIFGWLSPVMENWGIWGAGQSLLSSGATTGKTLVGCRGCIMENVNFSNWASRITGTVGVDFGGGVGFSYGTNVYMNNFGLTALSVGGGENQLTNSTIGTGGNNAMSMSSGSRLSSDTNVYYGGDPGNQPALDISGTLFSSNDEVLSQSQQSAPARAFRINSGGIGFVKNFNYVPANTSNDSGVAVLAGGILHLAGYSSTSSSLTSGGSIAGIMYDECGNSFGGPVTVTGTIFGACSITGTVITSAKLVLSAGWGTTAAWTALTGNTQLVQGTITASGSGQAANPTITYTFPTAFFSSPASCSATQIGGTQTAVANPFTPSSLTATGVTFTYNGTPGAGNTLVVVINCGNP